MLWLCHLPACPSALPVFPWSPRTNTPRPPATNNSQYDEYIASVDIRTEFVDNKSKHQRVVYKFRCVCGTDSNLRVKLWWACWHHHNQHNQPQLLGIGCAPPQNLTGLKPLAGTNCM